ncbi:MAG: acetamidase/formamidase family protein [Candidatus Hermodarchaeia archaeon]
MAYPFGGRCILVQKGGFKKVKWIFVGKIVSSFKFQPFENGGGKMKRRIMIKIAFSFLVFSLTATIAANGEEKGVFSEEEKVYLLTATPNTTHTGYYDNSLTPVLTINSGDTVVFETMTIFDNQFQPGVTFEELEKIRQPYGEKKVGPHTLTGPVYINGAEPGDVLEIRIKKLIPRSYGVNIINPGKLGTLPEDFPEGRIKGFYLDWTKKQTTFAPGIVVPLRPFLGNMGVAPKEPGKHSSVPPEYFGGNMDCKELVEGTTLYLPVQVKGALFSCGDAHAVQGDGEVCITALETALSEAKLQFIVRKDVKIERPMFESPTHWATMGFHEDLDEAVRIALRDMIKFLVTTKKMDSYEAYSLCSLQANLRVTQVVDRNKGIHVMMPKAIFRE